MCIGVEVNRERFFFSLCTHRKIKRSFMLLFATNTAMLRLCPWRHKRAREKSEFEVWKLEVQVSCWQTGNKSCCEENIDVFRGHTEYQQRRTYSLYALKYTVTEYYFSSVELWVCKWSRLTGHQDYSFAQLAFCFNMLQERQLPVCHFWIQILNLD